MKQSEVKKIRINYKNCKNIFIVKSPEKNIALSTVEVGENFSRNIADKVKLNKRSVGKRTSSQAELFKSVSEMSLPQKKRRKRNEESPALHSSSESEQTTKYSKNCEKSCSSHFAPGSPSQKHSYCGVDNIFNKLDNDPYFVEPKLMSTELPSKIFEDIPDIDVDVIFNPDNTTINKSTILQENYSKIRSNFKMWGPEDEAFIDKYFNYSMETHPILNEKESPSRVFKIPNDEMFDGNELYVASYEEVTTDEQSDFISLTCNQDKQTSSDWNNVDVTHPTNQCQKIFASKDTSASQVCSTSLIAPWDFDHGFDCPIKIDNLIFENFADQSLKEFCPENDPKPSGASNFKDSDFKKFSWLGEGQVLKNRLNTVGMLKDFTKQCNSQKVHQEKIFKQDTSIMTGAVPDYTSPTYFGHKGSHNSVCKQEHFAVKDNALVDRRVVYVGDIPSDYSQYQLRERFKKFGTITDVQLKTKENCDLNCFDPQKKMKRYGFITFLNRHEATEAIENGNKGHSVQFNLSFGGRRQFVGEEYRDLDGNVTEEWTSGFSMYENKAPRISEDDYDQLLQNALLSRGVKPQSFRMKCNV